MQKMTKVSATAALLLALSGAGVAAWAAPEAVPQQPAPVAHFPHDGPGFPPPPAPLYEASLQTRNPDEALNKLVANAPKGEGKNYEVRVSVRELPSAPPAAPEEKTDNQ
ncbi:hypothetical protein [Brenneria tiliae]|uniref:hypothetical protein n=1 Tax=Brenneria tiliae TaxID=2914984 RepID=UPI002014ADCC|nr:hypothetical protein [Brenneria tiliae]MCL2896233.1 hypothetical protein [Brenneria tiliae]MCL2900827.1 hypothetical protein [Brenneria tiliae]